MLKPTLLGITAPPERSWRVPFVLLSLWLENATREIVEPRVPFRIIPLRLITGYNQFFAQVAGNKSWVAQAKTGLERPDLRGATNEDIENNWEGGQPLIRYLITDRFVLWLDMACFHTVITWPEPTNSTLDKWAFAMARELTPAYQRLADLLPALMIQHVDKFVSAPAITYDNHFLKWDIWLWYPIEAYLVEKHEERIIRFGDNVLLQEDFEQLRIETE